jgi:type I restriction enzyme S subunit
MKDYNYLFPTIPKDWNICYLEDVCVDLNGIQTGPFGSLLHKKDYLKLGTPIITVEHLGENRILHKDTPCVSDEDRNRLKKFLLIKGDIVFSRVGSVDRRSLVRKDEEGWLFSGRCLRIRPDIFKINPEYLSWFFGLENIKEYIRNIAYGATMPSLNTKLLRTIPIIVPPFATQERIADILGSLDDKIELNRQMNETLEAMARAIFKSWFVDFDPVYAKMQGRDYPLPAEVMDLFPDELDESELGLIPKGWRVVELETIVKRMKLQKRYTKDEVLNFGEVPVFEQGNKILMGFHNNEPDIMASIDEPKFIFGDHTCTMKLITQPFSLGPNVIPLVGKDLPSVWVYYSSLDKQNFEEYRRHWMEFQIKKTILPDNKKILFKFIETIKPIIEKVNLNQNQNLTLEEVRNTLMPKLIKGEIDIWEG